LNQEKEVAEVRNDVRSAKAEKIFALFLHSSLRLTGSGFEMGIVAVPAQKGLLRREGELREMMRWGSSEEVDEGGRRTGRVVGCTGVRLSLYSLYNSSRASCESEDEKR